MRNDKWTTYKIQDIAEIGRGRVISSIEIERQRHPLYPVYSSQTSNNGIMGYLDDYMFDGEYITWTTDGANAGTVFYRKGKFNCTNVCGTLKYNLILIVILSRLFFSKLPKNMFLQIWRTLN